MKVEAFNSELNPFSIENLIKSEPSNAHANDSGYSAHSESGSEADNAESISPPRNTRSVGYDRIPNYSHLPFGTVPHVGAMGQSQAENAMFKNLLIYSNFIQMVQVRIDLFSTVLFKSPATDSVTTFLAKSKSPSHFNQTTISFSSSNEPIATRSMLRFARILHNIFTKKCTSQHEKRSSCTPLRTQERKRKTDLWLWHLSQAIWPA